MAQNADGSWTGPSGKTYPANTPESAMDPVDQAAADKEARDLLNTGPFSPPGTGRGAWTDGIPGWIEGAAHKLGITPNQVDPNAPGSKLDTQYADNDRQQQQDFINSLQQQATTGDGDWQQNFQQGVKNGEANAQALGQTGANAGGDYASSLRNIGNAQGQVAQSAVGDEKILRENAKRDAEDQLGQVFGGIGGMDTQQAANSAAVNRGVRQTNNALVDQGRKNALGVIGGVGGALLASSGGEVPGKPKVFGDDSRNDTVPAVLSPEEIVLPLSVTQSPDAPGAAADFVRSVMAKSPQHHMAQHFADGGGVDPSYEGTGVHPTNLAWMKDRLLSGPALEKPSIENGGRIDTSWSDALHGDMSRLSDSLMNRTAGGGSVAGTIAQQQNDQRLGEAQGALGRAPQGAVLSAVAQGDVRGAANAGETRQKEVARAQSGLGRNLNQMRAGDLGSAEAQQEAGWANTLTNSGLDLQNQQFARNLVTGAAQGVSALGHAIGGGSSDGSYARGGVVSPSLIDLALFLDRQSDENQQALDDLSTSDSYAGRGSASDLSRNDNPSDLRDDDPEFKAHGGRVGYADGGPVKTLSDPYAHEARKQAEWEEEGETGFRHKKAKKQEEDSLFARAIRSAGEYAQKAGAFMHFADGGKVDPLAEYRPMLDEVGRYVQAQDAENKRGADAAAEAAKGMKPFGGNPQGPLEKAATVFSNPIGALSDAVTGVIADPQNPNAIKPGVKAAAQDVGHTLLPRYVDAAQQPPAEPKAPPRAPPVETHQPRTQVASVGQMAMDAGVNPETPPEAAPVEPSPEQKAALAIGESEAQGARAQAKALAATQDQMAQNELERRDTIARGRARADDMYSRWQRLNDEMGRVSTTVDAGRYWASKSTGSKILGIIGLALGALGAGNDGVNKAAVMMGQAIDRDLEAQKAEHTIRLQKGRQQMEGAQTMYAMAHQATGDELAANSLAKSSALDNAKLETERIAASINDPIAKQKAVLLAAQLGQTSEKAKEEGKLRMAEVSLKEAQAGKLGRAGAGGSGLVSPGYALTPGIRPPSKDELSKWREGLATKNTLASQASDLGSMIRQHGSMLTGENSGRAEQLVGSMTSTLKEMEHLGAISTSDYAFLAKQIPDPTEWKSLGSRNSTMTAKLSQFATELERRFHEHSRSLGIVPTSGQQQSVSPEELEE